MWVGDEETFLDRGSLKDVWWWRVDDADVDANEFAKYFEWPQGGLGMERFGDGWKQQVLNARLTFWSGLVFVLNNKIVTQNLSRWRGNSLVLRLVSLHWRMWHNDRFQGKVQDANLVCPCFEWTHGKEWVQTQLDTRSLITLIIYSDCLQGVGLLTNKKMLTIQAGLCLNYVMRQVWTIRKVWHVMLLSQQVGCWSQKPLTWSGDLSLQCLFNAKDFVSSPMVCGGSPEYLVCDSPVYDDTCLR